MRDVISRVSRAQLVQEVPAVNELTPADLLHGFPKILLLFGRKADGLTVCRYQNHHLRPFRGDLFRDLDPPVYDSARHSFHGVHLSSPRLRAWQARPWIQNLGSQRRPPCDLLVPVLVRDPGDQIFQGQWWYRRRLAHFSIPC